MEYKYKLAVPKNPAIIKKHIDNKPSINDINFSLTNFYHSTSL